MCMFLSVAFSPPKVIDHYSASQIYLRFLIGIAHEGFSYPFCSKCHRVLLFLLCISWLQFSSSYPPPLCPSPPSLDLTPRFKELPFVHLRNRCLLLVSTVNI